MASADEPFLIVGGDSLLGSALQRRLAQEHIPFAATSRRANAQFRVDLSRAPEEWQLPDRCSTAVLCAARTNIAECERHPTETQLINVERTVDLARRLWERGAFVIFLSTNLVFDGTNAFPTVDDRPRPVTEYGRQKAQAEHALTEAGEPVAIVRLTKVVHPTMPLLAAWAASLRRGEPFQAFADMPFSPIPLEFVARALHLVAQRREPGIVHLSADRDLTYHMLAQFLARKLGSSPHLVRPTAAPGSPLRHTTLGMRAEDVQLTDPPTADATVEDLISALA